MQGELLLPTIFNVVVDAVVRHWEYLMEEGYGGDDSDRRSGNEAAQLERQTIMVRDDRQRRTEEGHIWLKVQDDILYADNGMVASTDLGWLQTAFETLMGLFDRLVLKTNPAKTVGMVCHPCRGGRGTGRQSRYPEDNRGGEELQGDTEGAGHIP